LVEGLFLGGETIKLNGIIEIGRGLMLIIGTILKYTAPRINGIITKNI
jgi:hypothetical protein